MKETLHKKNLQDDSTLIEQLEEILFKLLSSKVLLFCLFSFTLFLFLIFTTKTPTSERLIQGFFVLLSDVFLCATLYILMNHGLEIGLVTKRKFYKKYATTRRIKFLERFNPQSLTGRLSKKFIENYHILGLFGLSSRYKDFPVKVFYANFFQETGKSRTPCTFTLSEITIRSAKFPFLLLHNNSTKKYQENKCIGDSKDVEVTTGANHTRYSLYTTKNYELEALQICTSEFIELVQSSHLDLSVEFADDHIYIYTEEDLTLEKDLDELYRITYAIIENFGPFFLRMKDDYEVLHEVYNKN